MTAVCFLKYSTHRAADHAKEAARLMQLAIDEMQSAHALLTVSGEAPVIIERIASLEEMSQTTQNTWATLSEIAG